MAAFVPTSRSGRRISQAKGRRAFVPGRICAPGGDVHGEREYSGARVTTVRRWQPGTRVLVTFHRNGVRSEEG